MTFDKGVLDALDMDIKSQLFAVYRNGCKIAAGRRQAGIGKDAAMVGPSGIAQPDRGPGMVQSQVIARQSQRIQTD